MAASLYHYGALRTTVSPVCDTEIDFTGDERNTSRQIIAEEDGWGCRLQFCRLLRQYAHRFAFVQPQEAVEYLCLLRGRGGGSDYDKQQEKACMNECVDGEREESFIIHIQ